MTSTTNSAHGSTNSPINYSAIGFKCGLEIHQRVDTEKLFCNCYADPNKQVTEKFTIVTRQLRAAAGESGLTDIAAEFEAGGKKVFEYQCGKKTSCLVEADDEPPHKINQKALDVALQVAKTLKAIPVAEIHTMRKTIVDGSTVSGFQRTSLVALNGELNTSNGNVGIETVILEEESSGIVEKDLSQRSVYRLDRLGIPLIEIATDATIKSPEHAREVALQLGSILRNTGKVQRGLGTIRQDLNVSIRDGTRVEIKGAQNLDTINQLIENEVVRQQKLIELKNELEHRNARVAEKIVDVSKAFEKSNSTLLRTTVVGGGKILAVKLIGYANLLGKELLPKLRFGTELSDYAKVSAGVKGIIHSDENLALYGITQQEDRELERILNLQKGDAYVLCAEREDKARKALTAVIARAAQALQGIPPETRRADGIISHFMRPLAGAARMYPETDALPIMLTQQLWNEVQTVETQTQKVERYQSMGLNADLAQRMAGHQKFGLFEKSLKETQCDAITAAVTLLETLTALRREGFAVDEIPDEKIISTLREYGKGSIAKAGILEVLRYIAKSEKEGNVSTETSVNKLIYDNKLHKFEEDELRRVAVEFNGNISEIMKKFKANVNPAELTAAIAKLKQNGKLKEKDENHAELTQDEKQEKEEK